jgi:glycerol-3-phosphate acyltransferase PlsY
MNDHLSDRITAWFVYLISACGAVFSTMSIEWWQFISSLVLGIVMLIINYKHKKEIEKIARESGVKFDQ